MTSISLKEAKALQALTDLALEDIGKIELKEIFFDSIIYITPKALLLKKGNSQCWFGRSIIIKANNLKDENPNEPKSIEIYDWVTVNWQPSKKEDKPK